MNNIEKHKMIKKELEELYILCSNGKMGYLKVGDKVKTHSPNHWDFKGSSKVQELFNKNIQKELGDNLMVYQLFQSQDNVPYILIGASPTHETKGKPRKSIRTLAGFFVKKLD